MPKEINPQAEVQALRDVENQLGDLHGCIQQLGKNRDESIRGFASVMQAYLESAVDIMGSATDKLEMFVDRQVDGQKNKMPQAKDQDREIQ